MRFVSDRGHAPGVGFRAAVLAGLAPDGGLYVPESLPSVLDADGAWRPDSLIDAGVRLLAPFVDDLTRDELAALLTRAWDFPAPLVNLEPGLELLELFHGPTLAFKDFGARFLARYLEYLGVPLTLLVATSGDTGGAVAAGFQGARGIRVYVLYPRGRVSPIQEAQIATFGGNIHALTIDGSFDDCQRLVKSALADPDLAARHALTTANSINLGRLLPQMAYYGWALREPAALVVPSGNFGNVTAALYARTMGVPIGRITAAVNANDVVPRFLAEGVYRPGASCTTLSNAMDVAAPSNLSRLLHLAGGTAAGLGGLIDAGVVNDDTTRAEIRRVHETRGRFIDPHTAVGVAVARRLQAEGAPRVVVAATAHPAKFAEVIAQATGAPGPVHPALAATLSRPILARSLPPDDAAFKHLLETDP